jgi:hypothetical protein
MNDPSKYVGQIAAFYQQPRAVVDGLPIPGGRRLVGAVIGAKAIEPTARGTIPDVELTIRGKSGKVATISMVEHYANLYPTWHEAAHEQ